MKISKMERHCKRMEPPEGGWGWVVLLATSLTNFLLRAIDVSFGLLFGDLLKEFGVQTTGAAIITNGLDAVVSIFGLIAGPVIKTFSYRRAAVAGGALCFAGLLLTYPARSMVHFFISYSLLFGIGTSLANASNFVVISSYFAKKRGMGLGLATLGGSIAGMVFPQIVQFLVERYGFRGAILVLGSIILHIVAAGCLYEPVERHSVLASDCKNVDLYLETKEGYKAVPILEEGEVGAQVAEKSALNLRKNSNTSGLTLSRKVSTISIDSIISNIGLSEKYIPLYANDRISPLQAEDSLVYQTDFDKNIIAYDSLTNKNVKTVNHLKTDQGETSKTTAFIIQPSTNQQNQNKTVWSKIVEFFDLDILKDVGYLNLIFGKALYFLSDNNYRMVLSFHFLNENFSKSQTASFLSIQGIGDMIAKVFISLIIDKVQCSKRVLFGILMVFLGVCRSALAEQTDYRYIIIFVSLSGFFRGGCICLHYATISESFLQEKLPAAYGLPMVVKGLVAVIMGPMLGYIRDVTNSYILCIHFQSFLLVLVAVAWFSEYTIRYMKIIKQKNVSETTTI